MTTHRSSKVNGRWTSEEHRLFIEGLAKYGKDWKKIEDHLKTRDGAQIRSHAQKFFLRMTKEYKRMMKTGKYQNNLLSSLSLDSLETSRIFSEKEEEKQPITPKIVEKTEEITEKNELEGLEKLEKIKKALEMAAFSFPMGNLEDSGLSDLKQHHSFYNYMEKSLTGRPEKRKLSDLVEFPNENMENEEKGSTRKNSFTLYKKQQTESSSQPCKKMFCS